MLFEFIFGLSFSNSLGQYSRESDIKSEKYLYLLMKFFL